MAKYDFSRFSMCPDFRHCASVRDMYTLLNQENAIRSAYGAQPDPDSVREFRKARKARAALDPLRRPLYEGWRTHLDNDGIDASGRDYRILPEDPDDPWTDDEITEYVHDSEVYCGPSRYDFDCTGEKLTWGWHYTRTPAGIAIIHEWYYNT